MSAPVGDALHASLDGGEPVAASPADWEQAAPRVARYLRALGVRDPRDLERLSTAIRARFEHQVETSLVADAVETGIEEASKLLDEWLASELGPDAPGSMRGVARAVVLGGAVPGWVGVWSGRTPHPIDQPNAQTGERIRAGSLAPVPALAPLAMTTQRIDPCCHRLFRRLARRLRGMRPGSPAGSLSRRATLGQSR
ncbi:MAG: hypothetical protein KFB96_20705 [Thiocapsa sp.]|uniref:hypothetical protein n=1 Tax=Thiocapsa sp. TaxID=2024551 RepID=UPI001BCE87B8|nr:hypothetical protein [Thiocapsa sp.]QVL48041.1 MAG: hypothetical protein KFB96_20705 [Thiocapsa sp.]